MQKISFGKASGDSKTTTTCENDLTAVPAVRSCPAHLRACTALCQEEAHGGLLGPDPHDGGPTCPAEPLTDWNSRGRENASRGKAMMTK